MLKNTFKYYTDFYEESVCFQVTFDIRNGDILKIENVFTGDLYRADELPEHLFKIIEQKAYFESYAS